MALTLISTGGTIASTRNHDGSVSASLSGEELLARLPKRISYRTIGGHLPGTVGSPEVNDPASRSVDVSAVQVIDMSVPGSWNLSTELAASIADTAREAIEGGSEGVVITHGTDVLEETAWLAELIVGRTTTKGAVVFTASMRHADEFGGDGPRNLADALLLAADPRAQGRGSLICLNGEIHHSRWATKQHTTALASFVSPGRGPVGEMTPVGPVFHTASPSPPPASRIDGEGHTVIGGEVAIVASHWDQNPGLVPWLVDQGVAGIVVEGGGAGNINGNLADGVRGALSADIPVVVTSRCTTGSVQPIYGGKGGFATLFAAGAIGSNGLSAGKARLALQIALGVRPDTISIAEFFELSDQRA
ncbi:MAG: asparaginase [Microthrixaceae bacterium]